MEMIKFKHYQIFLKKVNFAKKKKKKDNRKAHFSQ